MQFRIALASSLALVIALALAPQAYGYNEVHYTVYYSCHVSPGGCGAGGDWYGCLVGVWTLDCQGEWSGWGMEPYTNCAEIVDVRTVPCPMDPAEQSVIPATPHLSSAVWPLPVCANVPVLSRAARPAG